MGDDEFVLVRAVAAGDVDAFEELYRRHARSLFGYIFARLGDRQLAEEALQDVALALWQGAGRFRGECSVRTWLFAVARRRSLTLRRRLPRERSMVDEELLPPSDAPGPLESTLTSVSRMAVRQALEQLPILQRETVELVYLHGMSGPEAAIVMNVPLGTVKSRLHRALKALAPLLEEVAS